MPRLIALLLFLVLSTGLFGCVRTPESIPRDAERSWSLKSDFIWTWSDNLTHGCVVWMAKSDWADVQILVETQCEGRRVEGYLEGKGLGYFSGTDYLLFRGYWPWTSKMWSDMLQFDDEGMLTGDNIHPCPFSLSQDQIDKMRVVVKEALAKTLTKGERRMLNRVDERLAATDGAALSSSQAGCTDQPLDLAKRASAVDVDPWAPSRSE